LLLRINNIYYFACQYYVTEKEYYICGANQFVYKYVTCCPFNPHLIPTATLSYFLFIKEISVEHLVMACVETKNGQVGVWKERKKGVRDNFCKKENIYI
jgi:hypothetical protein